MRNRDMPAHSVSGAKERIGNQSHQEAGSGGLTKREAAAIAAMQGQLASGTTADIAQHVKDVSEEECTAHYAVAFADALFNELDKDGDDA